MGDGADRLDRIRADDTLQALSQIALAACRDIRAGEEVCMDYAMVDGLAYDEFDCDCGAATCRGRVTGEDWRRPELWARYGRGFSPYLLRRIERLAAGHAGLDGAAAEPRLARRRRSVSAGMEAQRPMG